MSNNLIPLSLQSLPKLLSKWLVFGTRSRRQTHLFEVLCFLEQYQYADLNVKRKTSGRNWDSLTSHTETQCWVSFYFKRSLMNSEWDEIKLWCDSSELKSFLPWPVSHIHSIISGSRFLDGVWFGWGRGKFLYRWLIAISSSRCTAILLGWGWKRTIFSSLFSSIWRGGMEGGGGGWCKFSRKD